MVQLLPATGREMNVGDVHRLENNIHAGVKYMRLIVDRYFSDAGMDPLERGLFAKAALAIGASLVLAACARPPAPNPRAHAAAADSPGGGRSNDAALGLRSRARPRELHRGRESPQPSSGPSA